MPYDSKTGWNPATLQEIEIFYMNQVNQEFGTTYNLDSFRGSGYWQFYNGAMQKDKEMENKISSVISIISQEIQNIEDDFFYAQAGLFKGIRAALLAMEYIQDVSLYSNPTDDYFRGRLGIAIQYTDEKYKTDTTATQNIADVIVNNIGAGIWDYVENEKIPQDVITQGILEDNKQALDVSWKFAVLQNVKLKIEYKRAYGSDIPTDDDIKNTILNEIANKYNFGDSFTPDYYVRGCSFDFWREAKVSYSLDDGKTYKMDEFTPDYWVKLSFSSGDSIELVNMDSI